MDQKLRWLNKKPKLRFSQKYLLFYLEKVAEHGICFKYSRDNANMSNFNKLVISLHRNLKVSNSLIYIVGFYTVPKTIFRKEMLMGKKKILHMTLGLNTIQKRS